MYAYATNRPSRQNGAILITALVILVVLTILGLSGMNNSILEQRMAGNTRQAQIAFEAAESALRAGEVWLTTAGNLDTVSQLIGRFNGSVNGYYAERRPEPGAVINPLAFDITDPTAWNASNSIELSGFSANVAQQPRYLIQYLGRTRVSTGNKTLPELDVLDPNSNKPDLREYVFRVVAIGWGADGSAKQVLQSTLRKRLN